MVGTVDAPWLLAALALLAGALWRAPRPACRALWLAAALSTAAVAVAASSDGGLPHEPEPAAAAVGGAERGGAAAERGATPQHSGAQITPQFAEELYARLAPLREADGCRVVRFDTSRYSIDVGVQAPSGAVATLEIAATRNLRPGSRRVGEWMIAPALEFARHCGATLSAIEHALLATAPPATPRPRRQSGGAEADREIPAFAFVASALQSAAAKLISTATLILISLLLLVLGTGHILIREYRSHRPAPVAVALLVAVWGAGLALRLLFSPRTFLHEYYHVVEMISANLTGDIVPNYGWTGPVLYRTVAALLGSPTDVEVIFVTNAVLASLAIPAIALLDLALLGSWPRALSAAVLLAVLPLHLRFSAAEDLFILGVTFCLWATALFACYLRTKRLGDALCTALAVSLAMQTRPEMLFLPLTLVALVLCVRPGEWHILFARRTLLAAGLLAALLVPRLLELRRALDAGPPPAATLPSLSHYLANLVLFQPEVTPVMYWVLLAVGAAWSAWRAPGVLLWASAVFAVYTLFPIALFDNPPYRLRSQIFPSAVAMLVAGGAASLWLALWGRRRRLALEVGALALAGGAALVVVTWRGFVGELRDQQLEWAFLKRTVPQLPERGTLLAAVQVGGRNLNAFPQILLDRAQKRYALVDVNQAVAGEVAWPSDGDALLYYQGMFCFFAFNDQPPPEPMTTACRAVHERYRAEPLVVEELDVPGYSQLQYAEPPFRIGFYRLLPRG